MLKDMCRATWLCAALLCGAVEAEAKREIVVAKDGSGAFASIGAALDSVKNATPNDPVDILIKPGVYEETITTKNWVNLIGENRDACVIRYDGGPDKATTVNKHTIWATSNTAIKNLTIEGARVKYCIHSDGKGAYVLTVENCALRRQYPPGFLMTYPAAFGIGLRGSQHIMMKNCEIDAKLPIYWHNWNNQKNSCGMTLEKCALKGGDNALNIANLGSHQRDFFVLHDCSLSSAKEIVKYGNLKKAERWNGQNETELIGSGNRFSGSGDARIKDDTGKRLTSVELAAAAKNKTEEKRP